jgi:hypothetical protein
MPTLPSTLSSMLSTIMTSRRSSPDTSSTSRTTSSHGALPVAPVPVLILMSPLTLDKTSGQKVMQTSEELADTVLPFNRVISRNVRLCLSILKSLKSLKVCVFVSSIRRRNSNVIKV